MSEMKKETVCAVVVTYNRKELLTECLKSLLDQGEILDGIVLIDNNSEYDTPSYLFENGFINELPPSFIDKPFEIITTLTNVTGNKSIQLTYVRMDENTGGAGGFHAGVDKAVKLGYQWLWLMDDDVSVKKNAINTLLKYKEVSQCIHPSKEFLSGERFDWDGYLDEYSGKITQKTDDFKNKDFTFVNYGCFEGMFLHSDLIQKIGLPEKRFFFIGDDTLFGYKASKFTNVIYIKDILMTRLIDKRKSPPSILSDFLKARNFTIIAKEVSINKNYSSIFRFIQISFLFFRRVFIDKLPMNAWWILKGYKDGVFKKYGRELKLVKK